VDGSVIFYALAASPYYSFRMKAVGLPARFLYALVALPVGGVAGFYGCAWALPKMMKYLYGVETNAIGYQLFTTSLGVGAGVGFMAFLWALTLPWKRRRRRSGRNLRLGVSSVVVVVASAAFAGLHHALEYDLAFAAWLAYGMAFTFVRYGVVDSAQRGERSGGDDPDGDVD
jgi:hypothetical protein